VEWARRQEPSWTDDAISTELQNRYGFQVKDQADKFVFLYDELPTISDVLLFLQRNVFDKSYVDDFRLMEGYAERFYPRYGAVLRAQGVMDSTMEDHYAAHWITPALGQLFTMVQRLRPDAVDPTIQFTQADLLRVMGEQDVAPYFRERLLKISFNTLPLRQISQAVQQGRFDLATLISRFQDMGYNATDANLLAKTALVQGTRQATTSGHGFTPTVVSQFAAVGAIDFPTALAKLTPQGYTEAQVKDLFAVAAIKAAIKDKDKNLQKAVDAYAKLSIKAFIDGAVSADTAIAALQRAGYSADAANLEIATASLQVGIDRINAVAKAIRSAFLRGEVNAGEAQSALVVAGMQPARASDLVSRWTLSLTVPRKSASRSQILKWAKEGIISADNASKRLLNLGYSPDTVNLDLLDLARTIAQAKAQAAAKSAAILARAEAARDRATGLILKSYCKLYTPGKLKLQYAERIIDDGYVTDKLAKCGYNAESIANFLKDAGVARDKRDEQAAKKGPAGIEYTGPGAVT
jgi:hypothetical protein